MYCLIFSPTATRKEKKSVPQKKVGLDYLLEELELEDEAAGPTQDTSHTDKEISLYMSLPVVKGVEPLEWWKANQATFPTLAKLAKRYLCVPQAAHPSVILAWLATLSLIREIASNQQKSTDCASYV